jgi:hypothetical protein
MNQQNYYETVKLAKRQVDKMQSWWKDVALLKLTQNSGD